MGTEPGRCRNVSEAAVSAEPEPEPERAAKFSTLQPPTCDVVGQLGGRIAVFESAQVDQGTLPAVAAQKCARQVADLMVTHLGWRARASRLPATYVLEPGLARQGAIDYAVTNARIPNRQR